MDELYVGQGTTWTAEQYRTVNSAARNSMYLLVHEHFGDEPCKEERHWLFFQTGNRALAIGGYPTEADWRKIEQGGKDRRPQDQ